MKYTKGQRVVLKEPKDSMAWNSDMLQYVGKPTVMTEDMKYYGSLYGNYITVEIDGGEYMWFEDMFEAIEETYEIY